MHPQCEAAIQDKAVTSIIDWPRSEIEVDGFYAKTGSQLIMNQWNLARGKAECTKIAIQIVENNPDKGQLVAWLADMLMV